MRKRRTSSALEADPTSAAPRKAPRVSVIVPNYNYGKVLTRRLDSIYGQTFQDFEVILLDDASTDDSVAILESYAGRYPDKTRLLKNRRNTGSPFAQWSKGIGEARGELIWMAEADDYAGPHLLERLVGPFEDPAIALTYAKPFYVDLEGAPGPFQFEVYVEDLVRGKWDAPYVADGAAEVCAALGIRNTIPNASATVFRAASARPHIGDPLWQSMRMCGDWCLYLRMLKRKKLAYIGEAGAFYAFHENSSAHLTSRTPRFLAEHSMVVAIIRALFPSTPAETLRRNYEYVLQHFRWISGTDRPAVLENWPAVELSRLWHMHDALTTAEQGEAEGRAAVLQGEGERRALAEQLENSRAEGEVLQAEVEAGRAALRQGEAQIAASKQELEGSPAEIAALLEKLRVSEQHEAEGRAAVRQGEEERRALAEQLEKSRAEGEVLLGEVEAGREALRQGEAQIAASKQELEGSRAEIATLLEKLRVSEQHQAVALRESRRLLLRYREQEAALREVQSCLEGSRQNQRDQSARCAELEKTVAQLRH